MYLGTVLEHAILSFDRIDEVVHAILMEWMKWFFRNE